ncbi:MAG: rhodanese-like domain-containing protein [Candidatus Promineifilaceae bacterium]|jgi:hydroxyacylglutathione hydrolase
MQDEQPVKPANIANIVATNQGKLPLTMEIPKAQPLTVTQVEDLMAEGHIVVDTRSSADFGVGHIPRAYHAHLSSPEFEQRVGWVTPLDTPIILVTNHDKDAQHAIYNMAFIALNTRVTGYLDGGMTAWMDAGKVTESLPQMDVFTLSDRLSSNGLQVLDVREDDEYDEGHIEVAKNLSFKRIPTQLDSLGLNKEKPLAITCATGKRSSTAASLLLRQGFKELYNVTGGMTAWESAGFDTVFFEE